MSGSDYNKNRGTDAKDRRKEGIFINKIHRHFTWLGLMLSDMDQELLVYPEAYFSFLTQPLLSATHVVLGMGPRA